MVEYVKFLSKRTLLRRSNIFLILASISILFIVLVLNIRTQDRLYDGFAEQLELYKEGVNIQTNKLPTLDEGSEEYIACQDGIRFHEGLVHSYEKMIEYYDNEEWSLFYEEYKKALKSNIEIVENGFKVGENDDSIRKISDSQHRELTYIDYLDEHNLVYEDNSFTIFGLSYITQVSQFISPIIILITCIYILAQVYTLDYAKDIDISRLLPIGNKRTFLIKSLAGVGVSILVFLVISGVAFLLSLLVNFNAGLDYPYLLKNLVNGEWLAISVSTYFKDWLILGALFFTCVSIFVYFLSLWIKEDGTLFLIVTCIVLGAVYIPMFIEKLKSIAHLLPTTYMNYVNVSNGEMAAQLSNPSITFSMGVQVLCISIIAQFVLCFIINAKKKH